jgi:cbb3-type cytochrome oxidase subunit 3
MSGIGIDWIATLLFFLLFIAMVIAEILWLIKKGWATSGKATAYVLVTDLLGFGIGTFVIMSVLLAAMIMAFGPAGRGSNIPEAAYWVTLALGVIVPPIILFFTKRLMLSLFKMQSGKAAWIYSLVSSLLILVVVLVPPPIVFYILGTATGWK